MSLECCLITVLLTVVASLASHYLMYSLNIGFSFVWIFFILCGFLTQNKSPPFPPPPSCVPAPSPIVGFPFRDSEGEQRRGLHEEKFPRDAWVHETLQRAHHTRRCCHSQVSRKHQNETTQQTGTESEGKKSSKGLRSIDKDQDQLKQTRTKSKIRSDWIWLLWLHVAVCHCSCTLMLYVALVTLSSPLL